MVFRALAGALATGLVVAGAAVTSTTPATSTPPVPSGSLVYAEDAGDSLQLHALDLATNTDVALPGVEANKGPGATATSPDGTRVAVVADVPMIFGSALDVYDLTTHTWTLLAGRTDIGMGDVSWLPDSQHILIELPDAPETGSSALYIYALDGTSTLVPGTHLAGLAAITSYAVSPSGLQIAYSRLVSGVDKVFVMNIDGSSPTPLGITGRVEAWTHDGSRLLLSEQLVTPDGKPSGTVLRTVEPRGGGLTTLPLTYTSTSNLRTTLSPDDAWVTLEPEIVQNTLATRIDVVPLAGGAAPQTVLTTPTGISGASYLGARSATDSTAPTMPAVTVTLGATSTTVSWPLIRTPDVVGVRVALSLGATPPATYAAGARRTTALGATRSVSFTGLTTGATYSYSAWALDGAGNLSVPVTGHLRLIPAATVTAPAFASRVSAVGVPVTYSSAGGGTAGVQVGAAYTSSGAASSFGPSGFPVPGTSGTFTFTPAVFLAEGSVMRFRAGAVDAYGNVRWSTTSATSVVPYDDRDPRVGRLGAWSQVSTTGAWLGTTSVTNSGGSVSLRAGSSTAHKRFTVVATTSATGGSVKAYVNGRYLATFSTRGATGLRRNVWTSPLLAAGAQRLVLVQVKGSGWFRLDGIGVTFS